MRRRIDMHPQSLRLQHRACKGAGRTFAVRAGDVDDRRQFVFRMAERRKQPLDAIENEIDPFWMKSKQALKNGAARAGPHSCCTARRGGVRRPRWRPIPRSGRLFHQQMHQAGKRLAQVVAVNHHVDHSVVAQILRTLEPFRQPLANRLLDHTLAGEARQARPVRRCAHRPASHRRR